MKKVATKLNGFTIRFATKEDAGLILKFIKELADYEGELTATEEDLRHSIFERDAAEVIIGEYHEEPVGFALFHQNFSTFLGRPGLHLVDLYIIPSMRGKGFGTMILSYLAKLTVKRDRGRLEWWCHDWNDPAIEIYKNLGAFPLDNIRVYRLFEDKLIQFSRKCEL
ncbi:GNAT family N-acetyltransferase [Inediibacterium massiliense]|uniref:GNAT family N-acetyltransferase n=1 Tax=Inediibacterium massiliense TaxID=1658111 RepID=UPI0006B46CDA|nr:GNAT family N-acetyltransferase [Inediibacterium massiliense]